MPSVLKLAIGGKTPASPERKALASAITAHKDAEHRLEEVRAAIERTSLAVWEADAELEKAKEAVAAEQRGLSASVIAAQPAGNGLAALRSAQAREEEAAVALEDRKAVRAAVEASISGMEREVMFARMAVDAGVRAVMKTAVEALMAKATAAHEEWTRARAALMVFSRMSASTRDDLDRQVRRVVDGVGMSDFSFDALGAPWKQVSIALRTNPDAPLPEI
jgi:hypothetical protein